MGDFGGLYTLLQFQKLQTKHGYLNMRHGFKNTHFKRWDVWAVARARWSSLEIC
jgi:hypothetical protein